MRYGIPVLGDRIAPRCTHAESLLVVTRRGGRIVEETRLGMEGTTWADLLTVLSNSHVDTLVCGGIDRHTRRLFESKRLSVIENVASSTEAVVDAIRKGELHPGFGFEGSPPEDPLVPARGRDPKNDRAEAAEKATAGVDCLSCEDRACLRGEPCAIEHLGTHETGDQRVLESAMDIALERERTLCRLSELIYFCLEMEYRRVGVAFCVELREPTETLVSSLRRFFEVIPVCCKIGGGTVREPGDAMRDRGPWAASDDLACNPRGQAAVLNEAATQLNVAFGLCMGADCVFNAASHAPVSTFVVKDRSLANNPIGALYSDHYLEEAARASF